MNPCELTASITALANTMACNMNDNQLNIAAVFFTQLGDTLDTIAVQRSICSGSNSTPCVKADS